MQILTRKTGYEILKTRLRALPPGPPDLLDISNNFDEWVAGEDGLRQVLENRLKSLPPRHPAIAVSYTNLGAVQQQQGKLKEAEESMHKALEIVLDVLPPEHAAVATGYTNLGAVQYNLGKWKEAEKSIRAAGRTFELARMRAAPRSSTRMERTFEPYPPADLWSACLVRLQQPEEAWQVAEANRARGRFDDPAAGQADTGVSLRERQARLDKLDLLILPLTLTDELQSEDEARLKELRRERDELLDTLSREAAEQSRREVYALASIQKQMPPDTALVFWIDLRDAPHPADPWGDHWACVARSSGPPRWVQLEGTGDKGVWTDSDRRLVFDLRDSLVHGIGTPVPFNLLELRAGSLPNWQDFARRLHDQRLKPLEAHLRANGDLPPVRHLVIIPTGWMAGLPVELLTDRYRVSYASSSTLFARTREHHRRLSGESLLALGDPAFRGGFSQRFTLLPASRVEVRQIAGLFPEKKTVTLLGSDASEQRLDELTTGGGLKRFRVLHLATHAHADDPRAERSFPFRADPPFLAVADDKLPDSIVQQQAGKKVYNGRLTVAEIGMNWELDADVVPLSACGTAVAPDGGGEGLLGLAQVLFRKGARSLVLSLWKVDDIATALLMIRFYENLLGKREGLKQAMGRLEALREAQQWLRELPRGERDRLAEKLGKGMLQTKVLKGTEPIPNEEQQEKGGRPYAHPKYWAAFILFGDPD
jgi:CHAT domain-containing protein